MPEHEPRDIADEDRLPSDRDEPRAARKEPRITPADQTPGRKGRQPGLAASGSDDAQVASEPMDLQRLPDEGRPPPPGRQRTGDPPAR